ncbi:Glycosyltransferase involved in cell wall bisynthesis [Algoriphagus ornithinivorans]|uniref:Glycosyltransferase involved in cell wall bisynthesis n=1 Tax=Algoriphagus ornithinivorans TaxID=226506 RepID=A0A1I5HIA6_9BACT|nr:glycosyltransferase family 2 protein [Algoriphagus ornithinivorans]SFO47995.1 Glycosyltransferase involved in cell wall bisynthesis [Algoriphagus ornithinivorans]
MDSPTFSIILPTYNSARTISKALESILDQDYKNYEVLVMDGNSEDNTVQIVKGCNDPRIKIISKRDNGIYDAMNKGVALAKGEWLYFLGSDDTFYSDDVLGKVVSSFRPEMEVVYGNVCRTKYESFYDGLFDENKILKRNICHQAIFIKKSLFNRIGNFNIHYKSTADWDHNMRWLLSPSIQHFFINEIIANYADGGFSSKFIDVAFEKDKMLKYLRYSKNMLPLKKKLFLIKLELVKHIKDRNTNQVFRLLYYVPSILLTPS